MGKAGAMANETSGEPEADDAVTTAPGASSASAVTVTRSTERVPWRTIWATIGSVVAAAALILVAREMTRVLAWMVIAAFLAFVLDPAVAVLCRRLHLSRLVAAAIVYVVGFAVIVGLGYAFIHPLIDQGQEIADDLPRLVEDARAGRGPIGELVTRFDLERRVAEQQEELQSSVNRLGSQSVHVLGVIGNALAGLVSVLVLSFLMLLEGPRILAALTAMLPDSHRDRVVVVARDCNRTVTGYMAGNLVISVIAGVAAYIFLWITGVPFKGLLALWVGIADLIPLLGATLGAVVVVIVAFLHSPVAGIAAIAFFIVYQQVENHLLQPVIQARTVKLSPLTVLVSVLIGVELAGILGALLAIPAAGIASVIVRDLWANRGPRLRPGTPGR
jgi:predicted PurR-regulated permease PerM